MGFDVAAGGVLFDDHGFAIDSDLTHSHDFSPPFDGPKEIGDKGFDDVCAYVADKMRHEFIQRWTSKLRFQKEELRRSRLEDPEAVDGPPREDVTFTRERILEAVERRGLDIRAARDVEMFFSNAVMIGNDMDVPKMCGMSAFTGVLNHSCHPNAEVVVVPATYDRDVYKTSYSRVGPYRVKSMPVKLCVQATKPIKLDEEITIAYQSHLDYPGREHYLRNLKFRFGFDCRCDPCRLEKKDPLLRRLKEDTLSLLSSLATGYRKWSLDAPSGDFEPDSGLVGRPAFLKVQAPLLYLTAANILDGFAELGMDHAVVLDVWDMCVQRAQFSGDMIRAHWFCSKLVQRAHEMYGKSMYPHGHYLSRVQMDFHDFRNNRNPEFDDIEICSTVPEDGYNTQQEGLYDLMFALDHKPGDEHYPFLHVVEGKVEKLSGKDFQGSNKNEDVAKPKKSRKNRKKKNKKAPQADNQHLPVDEPEDLLDPETPQAEETGLEPPLSEDTESFKSQRKDSEPKEPQCKGPEPEKRRKEDTKPEKSEPEALSPKETVSKESRFENLVSEEHQSKDAEAEEDGSAESCTEPGSPTGTSEFEIPEELENQEDEDDGWTVCRRKTKPPKPTIWQRRTGNKYPIVNEPKGQAFKQQARPANVQQLPPVDNNSAPLRRNGDVIPRTGFVPVALPAKMQPTTDPVVLVEKPKAMNKPASLKETEKPTFPSRFLMSLHYHFVSKFGDPDAISKQAWLSNTMGRNKLQVAKARDIGHLLAAKDGYTVKNEGYVLETRRDSVCGRVEGQRDLVEFRGAVARRARTHSFSNDKGKKDDLKLADVRESREW